MTARLTIFILTQVHCMLTVIAAYSFLAQPHWVSACLVLLYAPKAKDRLTMKLTHVIQHAIQSSVKKPKQPKFAHPRIRKGTYWRRIRNRTRRLQKQPMYRYIKVLCWLHHSIQQSSPQQPESPKQRASQPNNEQHTHMQDSVKRQETKMLQHNTSLTTIGTLTAKSANQHVHIIARQQMLLSILETK